MDCSNSLVVKYSNVSDMISKLRIFTGNFKSVISKFDDVIVVKPIKTTFKVVNIAVCTGLTLLALLEATLDWLAVFFDFSRATSVSIACVI